MLGIVRRICQIICTHSEQIKITDEFVIFRIVIPPKCSQSPPTFILYMAPLDAWVYTVSWLAVIKLAYRIAPPDLIGTMSAIVNVLLWTVGSM